MPPIERMHGFGRNAALPGSQSYETLRGDADAHIKHHKKRHCNSED